MSQHNGRSTRADSRAVKSRIIQLIPGIFQVGSNRIKACMYSYKKRPNLNAASQGSESDKNAMHSRMCNSISMLQASLGS